MKMDVMEVYPDTTVEYEGTKVVWRIDGGKIGFLWDEKIIMFDKEHLKLTKKQKKKIRKVWKQYFEKPSRDGYKRDIYMDGFGELFLVSIYIKNGAIIWINSLDDGFPAFVFQMVK